MLKGRYIDSACVARLVEEVAVDPIIKLLVDICGTLGFFMGFSYVTFIEVFVLLYTLFSSCCGKKEQKRPKSSVKYLSQ